MGSIILAGVLLKLGGMGILIFKKLLTVERRFIFFIFISLLLWGRCIVGLICFYQNDRKVLIAFSRVNHITLVILRIIYGRNFSVLGGLLIIIGHGLASSLLFFLISFPYSQSSNRNFFTLGQRGLTRILPILWVLGLLVNMGFPPFLNFLGEIFIISILLSNPPLFFFFFFNFIIGALYTFSILRNIIQKKKNYFLGGGNQQRRIFLVVFIGRLHLLPIGLFINFFLFF